MSETSHRPEKLVASMLSGNSEELVTDAIESVLHWIDELLLIDTGISDATIERARQASDGELEIG